MKECEDCIETDIADWEVDSNIGKAKAILWCERLRKFCEDVTECEYFDNGEGE